MPQLNPAPWFAILTFTWLIFLLMIPTVVLAHKTLNNPTPQSSDTPQTSPWDWLWY